MDNKRFAVVWVVLLLFLTSGCASLQHPITKSTIVQETTFEEVKKFFTDAKQFYEPPDEKLNKELAETVKASPELAKELSPTEGYYYPAVKISDLWKRLGIKRSLRYLDTGKYRKTSGYLFGSEASKQSECLLRYPEVKLFEFSGLKVLQVSESMYCDYQLFLFKKDKDGRWLYFDHIDASDERYGDPKLKMLSNELLSLTVLSSRGTGILSYQTLVFDISGNKIEQVLGLPGEGERHGWGVLYDCEYKSEFVYSGNTLTGNYKISIFPGASQGIFIQYDAILNALNVEVPFFTVNRKIIFKRDGSKLRLDNKESTITVDDLDILLSEAYKDFYRMFKVEFDGLQQGDKVQKEWYKYFKLAVDDKLEAIDK